MGLRLILRNAWISGTLALCLVGFQNCSPVNHSSDQETTQSKRDAGPYTGLQQKIYRYFDSVTPCSAVDRTGKALPNEEVLIRPNSQGVLAPHLTREQCQDVTPQELAASDVQFSVVDQSLIYKNNKYTGNGTPGDFDLVTASCPAGKTPKANPTRVNVITDSLDWTAPSWYANVGVTVSLYSTIESLPAYLIKRTNSQSLDYWQRDSVAVNLQASTAYAYSVLVQPGTVNGIEWNLYRDLGGKPNDEGGRITFDFQTMTTTINYATNLTGFSATVTPFGSAYLCSVYFNSSATDDTGSKVIMGVGPSANSANYGALGDSMIGTAAQLVPVNQFCQ